MLRSRGQLRYAVLENYNLERLNSVRTSYSTPSARRRTRTLPLATHAAVSSTSNSISSDKQFQDNGNGTGPYQEQEQGQSSNNAKDQPDKVGTWNFGISFGRRLRRFIQIWSFAIVFAVRYWLVNRPFMYKRGGMTPKAVRQRRLRLARWLRRGLVRLGPTFIKIGQQFSTRIDILSPEFIKQLEVLQDNVPGFDPQYAVSVIETDLGKPLNQIFDDFTMRPLAAASLGQVHRAVLNGQQVAIKVQRPGLRQLFDVDLKNIKLLAQWIQWADKGADGAARDWVAIYHECARILYQEIDYIKEGESAQQFASNFESVEWVKVPAVYLEYTSPRVLVMEYVPGVKINNVEKIDSLGLQRSLLARRMVEGYLLQLLKHGLFHADPHPGNVSVDTAAGGRLIYYDFGMVGTIPQTTREGLFDLFYAVYQRDAERCLNSLRFMGVIEGQGDPTALRRGAQFFLDQFDERLKQQRALRAQRKKPRSLQERAASEEQELEQLQRNALANIGEDILQSVADQPFRFPAKFTFVARAFSVLDSIGKTLDTEFDLAEIAGPYARDFLLDKTSGMKRLSDNIQKRSYQQGRALVNLFRGPNTIENMHSIIDRIQRGDLKLRVRAMQAERGLTRVLTWQQVLLWMVVTTAFINIATVLHVSALIQLSMACWAASCMAFVNVVRLFLKVRYLDQEEAKLSKAQRLSTV